MYEPTTDDIRNVIQLLNDNGIVVKNSKLAYEQLKQYETNPSFCVLLSRVFECRECPVQNFQLNAPWIQYRLVAGITLKNNINAARHLLGENAVKEAAKCALRSLCDSDDLKLSRVSAQIVVKIILITSFEWWTAAGFGDLPSLLLNDLLPGGNLKTFGALYALQFIMEDMPKLLGTACGDIIIKVSEVALNTTVPMEIRKASFRICFNIYEQSSFLEWDFGNLSPLQQGLVTASWPFAKACTVIIQETQTDYSFLSVVFRSCAFLLDYFEYFPQMSATDIQNMVSSWVGYPMEIIRSANDDSSEMRELLSAAIELLTFILDIDNREGGAGIMSNFSQGILHSINQLVPKVVFYAQLSEDEVNNIMSVDDYRVRDNGIVKMQNEKDISEETFLDDEETAMTLRRSALRFIASMSEHSSSLSCQPIFAEIEKLWSNPDWKAREAGAVLIGTIATGSRDEIEAFLPSVLNQLLQFAKNTEEHICVSSISFWSLSQLFESILCFDINAFHSVISTIASRLQSTSKRIQLTSCSALNTAFALMEPRDDYAILQSHNQEILNFAYGCLSAYTTQNLSILSQLLAQIISFTDNPQELTVLKEVLKTERSTRAQLFETSYNKAYIVGEPNALLDKDIFALDSVLLVLSTKISDEEFCFSNLDTWTEVLKDVLARGVTDDVDLVSHILSICYGYIRCVGTSNLRVWLERTSWTLPTLAYKVLTSFKNTIVISTAVNFLVSLLQQTEKSSFPEGMWDAILESQLCVVEDDDSQLKEARVHLICSTIIYRQQYDEKALSALQAANSCLRDDVFGEYVFYYCQMACHICQVLEQKPEAITYLNIPVILQLLTRLDNNFVKSQATINVCRALAAEIDLTELIPSFIGLTISWSEIAASFSGTQEALTVIINKFNTQYQNIFKSHIQTFQPGIRRILSSLYNI